ncbi:MAG: ANTAR domain-containing protein [Clostridia bacterium]|nr:ANTAR domain-containing protein [Clostridia bacterium]
MELQQQTYHVLVVTASKTFRSSAAELLSETRCAPVQFVSDISAAKRAVAETPFDFVIVNAPLPDDAGIRFALDVSDQKNAVVLLLLPPDLYAESSDRAISHGVFLLSKPISKNGFLTAIGWLSSARELVRKSEHKIASVDEKMKEIRIVNRAKWLLIEHRHLSETDAHRSIEKQAMDRCTTRLSVAQEIIDLYSDG